MKKPTMKLIMKAWLFAAACAASTVSLAQSNASLADLIEAGDRTDALELLRVGANVNAAQDDGTTALHWAVYRVDAELTAMLLAREADPDAINEFGSTPLAEAVKIANPEIVAMLLDAGADPEAANEDGQTALMLATRTGETTVAELLIAHGANVNAVEAWRGQTALMWAAAGNFADLAELLIDHGADVSLRATTFDWGSQITSEPRSQYRPSAGLTPLLYAVRGDCLRCVQAILAKGADIDLPDPDGVTPLMAAIDNLHFGLAKYLLEQGADPHSWDWRGRTPLYIAVDVNSLDNHPGIIDVEASSGLSALDIMRLLLDAGVNPNPQLNMLRPGRGGSSGRFADDLMNAGMSPLLRAANSMDVPALNILLAHGALIELPNAMGVTPLLAASGYGSGSGLFAGKFTNDMQPAALATVKVLLDAGADIKARITDTTSHTARIARANTMNQRQGQSVVFGAIAQGWMEVLQYLLANGAELDVVDDFGKTPMDAALAQAGGRDLKPNEAMVSFLKELGVTASASAAP